MSIILRPYQEELKANIYRAWEDGHQNVLAVLPTGLGKCLGKDTIVLMHNGTTKKVQDIGVGDLLMGPDSLPRRVLSTSNGTSEMFKITPIKGEPWVCNDIHVLSLIHTETGKIIDIPLNEYTGKTKNFKHLHKQFRTGVEFKKQPISYDPYIVGLYLAEGSYHNPQITNPDKEVIKYCRKWAKKNNMKLRESPGRGCSSLNFSDYSSGWYKNKIRNLAQLCTSKDNRFIPREFLINDRATRLQVLAGLLDGDGYYYEGTFEIVTKYENLRNDVLFLARSLGFAAYCTKKIGTIKKINFTGEYYRITISGHVNEIPTLIKRKQAAKRKQIKDVLRTGFSVKSIGNGEYYGFTLDGDGRFLLGDFTVTHNTVCFCSIAIDLAMLAEEKLPTAIMVHRKELVQQISLTLSKVGVMHNIIAPRPTILGIIAGQRKLYKKQFYNHTAPISVLSVDTLNSRSETYSRWAKTIRLWITDEAAHLLKNNKWGLAVNHFPNAKGLGVTATPQRLDKRGLGRHADGVFDTMIQGPSSKWGIQNNFLCKYKIAIPMSDYQTYLKKASSNSDYSKEAMTEASQKSHIVGDVVDNYIKFASGKQAIVFSTDIASAGRITEKFNEQGIKAELLTGLTNDRDRLEGMIKFRDKTTKVLINVDLFDEGLDVPGIECVIMARPTMSLSKFLQTVGRGLRPAENKSHLILIDHVGNVSRHGLPDQPRQWSLDRVVKRQNKINLIRICANVECNSPFDRLLNECPWCGLKLEKKAGSGEGRIGPEQVDGDLELIDPDILRQMEKDVNLESPESVAERVGHVAGKPAAIRAMRNQAERIETQRQLSEVIALWAGQQRQEGLSDRMIHKKFYINFDKTITQSLAEPKVDMLETMRRITGE